MTRTMGGSGAARCLPRSVVGAPGAPGVPVVSCECEAVATKASDKSAMAKPAEAAGHAFQTAFPRCTSLGPDYLFLQLPKPMSEASAVDREREAASLLSWIVSCQPNGPSMP
jgi:hypothetical protein